MPARHQGNRDRQTESFPVDPKDSRRKPIRNCHSRLSRGERTGNPHGRDLGGGGQALAAPLQGRRGLPDRQGPAPCKGHGADRILSVDRGDPARRRSCRARTRSIRATACCRKARNSPMPAPRPASSSSGRRPTPCAGSATRWRRATWRIEVGVPVIPATDPLPDDPATIRKMAAGNRLSGDAQGIMGRRRARHARHPQRGGSRARGDRGQARGARPPSARTRSISKS